MREHPGSGYSLGGCREMDGEMRLWFYMYHFIFLNAEADIAKY